MANPVMTMVPQEEQGDAVLRAETTKAQKYWLAEQRGQEQCKINQCVDAIIMTHWDI